MQRPDPGRAGSTKRGGGGKRGGGRRALSVGSPLLVAALFGAFILYSHHRFSGLASGDASGVVERRGHQATDGAAVGDGGVGSSALEVAGGGGGGSSSGAVAQREPQKRSSWLSAAVLWAEDHHTARLQAQVRTTDAVLGGRTAGSGPAGCCGCRPTHPRSCSCCAGDGRSELLSAHLAAVRAPPPLPPPAGLCVRGADGLRAPALPGGPPAPPPHAGAVRLRSRCLGCRCACVAAPADEPRLARAALASALSL